MRAFHPIRRFFAKHRKSNAPPPPDGIRESLRAAIAADVRATATNIETHEARVNAMIEDFFAKYGGRDAGFR